jgi:hypothetical protein
MHVSTSNYHDEKSIVGAARKNSCNNLVKIAGGEVNHETNIVSLQNNRALFRRNVERDKI